MSRVCGAAACGPGDSGQEDCDAERAESVWRRGRGGGRGGGDGGGREPGRGGAAVRGRIVLWRLGGVLVARVLELRVPLKLMVSGILRVELFALVFVRASVLVLDSLVLAGVRDAVVLRSDGVVWVGLAFVEPAVRVRRSADERAHGDERFCVPRVAAERDAGVSDGAAGGA